MFLFNDYYTPRELTGYARAALADRPINQFSFSRWLPDVRIDDLDYRFTRSGEGLIEAATYRQWDTPAQTASRPGLTRVSGELPPISRKIPLTEYNRLKQRANGGDGTFGGLLKRDAVRLVKSIDAKLEYLRAQALVTGAVSLSENGVTATVTFGRDAGMSVTAAVTHATASTDVLTDLLTWTQAYTDLNGVPPGVIVTSTTVVTNWLKNTAFRQFAWPNGTPPTRLGLAPLQGVFADYNLPPIVICDRSVNLAGTSTKILATDKVLFLPADGSELGATLFGTTVEAISSDYDLIGEEAPGIVVGNWETKDPITLWTKADAVALPVLANPSLAMVADVVP